MDDVSADVPLEPVDFSELLLPSDYERVGAVLQRLESHVRQLALAAHWLTANDSPCVGPAQAMMRAISQFDTARAAAVEAWQASRAV